MKKINKIIALITSFMMLSSVSAFAAAEDGMDVVSIGADTAVEYILTSTVGDSVKAGDTFDVAVKVGAKDSADYVGIGTLTFDVEYDTTLFDVAVSASQPTSNSTTRIEGADEENYFWMAKANSNNISSGVIHTAKVSPNAGKAYAGYFNNSDMHVVSTENAFLTFTFTVKADAPDTKGVTLSLTGCAATNTVSTVKNSNITTTGSYTFNIGADEPVVEDKTEATVGANGDVTFDYADDDAASSALAGKRVVLDSAKVSTDDITADTTVSVTYTENGVSETKTFGETLYSLLGLDGDGSLAAKTVKFGIVCDPALTGTFTFALN